MGKKTTSVRKSKDAKAGGKRRKLHEPVFRLVEEIDRVTGKAVKRQKRCSENERKGKNSNQAPWKYNGCPLACYK